MGIEAELAVSPMPGFDLSLAGSLIESEFDSSVPEPLATRTGIREGNRLPTVPKFQLAATATYGQEFGTDGEWYVSASVQHVGNRFTQPGDQEPGAGNFTSAGGNPAIFYDPDTGAFGTTDLSFGSLRLPSYELVNLSGGLQWDNGLAITVYVNNLFDTNAKLSLDRERGARARISYHVSQPRTYGLTVRKSF